MSTPDPATQEPCPCRNAIMRAGHTVLTSISGDEMNRIQAGSDLVARSVEKWMSLFRCRTCGAHWVEACYTSGQMDWYYLFPAPPTDDPVRWLNEEAQELPPR